MYLYIMKADKYYKIGVTDNIDRRTREIQTGCPFKIEHPECWVYSESKAREIENKLHKTFIKQQTYGEWFELTDEDISYIRDILLLEFTPVEILEGNYRGDIDSEWLYKYKSTFRKYMNVPIHLYKEGV